MKLLLLLCFRKQELLWPAGVTLATLHWNTVALTVTIGGVAKVTPVYGSISLCPRPWPRQLMASLTSPNVTAVNSYKCLLAGSLVSNYDGVQCCGGRAVSSDLVCCGDSVSGQAYASDSTKSCCGQLYVDILTTHCCTDNRGRTQVPTLRITYNRHVKFGLVGWKMSENLGGFFWLTLYIHLYSMVAKESKKNKQQNIYNIET